MATKTPIDHLATRTVIGQGRKKPPPVGVTFNGSDYDLPGKAPVGFIEAAAKATGLDLDRGQMGMWMLAAFMASVVPKSMAEDLRRNGDADDLNEIFEVWNTAVGAGESSGSSD